MNFRYLAKPDDLTTQALRRLMRENPDFARVASWLAESVCSIDDANRSMLDSVLLRQNQGGASAIQELLDHASAKGAVAQAVQTPRNRGSGS